MPHISEPCKLSTFLISWNCLSSFFPQGRLSGPSQPPTSPPPPKPTQTTPPPYNFLL